MKLPLAVTAAWLIGIATALTVPGLAVERTMIVVRSGNELRDLGAYNDQGWIVSQSSPGHYYVLERSRIRLP